MYLFAQIYEYGLKEEAEESGPLSGKVEHRLRMLDRDVRTFLRRLREVNMEQSVSSSITYTYLHLCLPYEYRYTARTVPCTVDVRTKL